MAKFEEHLANQLFTHEELPPGKVAITTKAQDGTEYVCFMDREHAMHAIQVIENLFIATDHHDIEYLSAPRN